MATKRTLLGTLVLFAILLLLPGVEAIDITLSSPANATTILKASTVDLTIAGGGVVNVTYTIDAAITNTSLANPWDITANWTKGLNILTVYAINGSESSQNTFQFTINNSVPVVNSVDPVNNTVLATTVNLTAAVQDLDGISDVDDVKFYYSLANESVWTLINNVTTHTASTFSTAWNLSAISDATYKIKAVANDSEITGEIESAANITINNINQNPIVDLTSLTGGQVVVDEQAITWTATDADGENLNGKISIYYSTDNSTWTLIAGNQVNDGTYTWDTDGASNGATYRLNITATDNFGGYGNDISGSTFTINNQAGGGGSSSSSSDSGSGEVSASGNAPATAFDVSQIFQELVPGTKELNINVADLAIKKLIFTVSEGEIDARIKIRDIETLPTSISVEPAGIYQLFEVEATNLDSLTSATFEFEIPKAWLTSNNLDVSDIIVKRYTVSWTNILTTYVGENGNNYKFTATTPGFSIFAITGKSLTEGGDVVAQTIAEESGKSETSGGLLSGFAVGDFSLPGLPDLSFLPGGWTTMLGIIIAVAVISVFAASKQGLITLPTSDDLSRPREHAARLRTRMKNNRHAPTKKFKLPAFEFPQLEMPDFMGNKKQKKLKFGKNGWNK
ncbi:MAG: PGF-pre-PGF domain-containing protein [Nanoarchaeota archaeon]